MNTNSHSFFQRISLPLARIALFVIYVWFGVLKVIGQSPASPMVRTLLSRTMPFFPFDTFIILFGLFEILIGILFLIPRVDKATFVLFAIHMITTTMPLFLMPSYIWAHAFVPTLEGQYIIKNLTLIACTVFIGTRREPDSSYNVETEKSA